MLKKYPVLFQVKMLRGKSILNCRTKSIARKKKLGGNFLVEFVEGILRKKAIV